MSRPKGLHYKKGSDCGDRHQIHHRGTEITEKIVIRFSLLVVREKRITNNELRTVTLCLRGDLFDGYGLLSCIIHKLLVSLDVIPTKVGIQKASKGLDSPAFAGAEPAGVYPCGSRGRNDVQQSVIVLNSV